MRVTLLPLYIHKDIEYLEKDIEADRADRETRDGGPGFEEAWDFA
nr:hypothetical protein [Candidatus Sigynarchaeota archaeon]